MPSQDARTLECMKKNFKNLHTYCKMGKRGLISWDSVVCIPDCVAAKHEGDKISYSGDYQLGCLHKDWQEMRKTQEN
jgi:hypothetical protein